MERTAAPRCAAGRGIMRPVLANLARGDQRALWAWVLVIALCGPVITSGGLGLAAAAVLFALLAFPLAPAISHLRQHRLATMLAVAAVVWTTLSYAWSPYRNPEEVLKFAILTPLFILVPVAAARIGAGDRVLARTALIGSAAFAVFVLMMESLNGGDVALSYKLGVEGYTPDRTDIPIRVDRVLSRGATPAIMLSGIAIMLLWTQRDQVLKIIAAALAVMTVCIAFDFSVAANSVAVIAAALLTAIALKWPVATLRTLLIGLGLTVLTGPILFTALLSFASPEFGAALPMSWEWRLEIWRFALERIGEAPLAGYGIGASRVIDATMQLRGHEIDLLPLHAHNAALTIWLETGFVGAALTAATLFALARSVRIKPELPALTIQMIVFALTVWAVNVAFSYGIWQEWHHGGLALAIAAAFASRPARNG